MRNYHLLTLGAILLLASSACYGVAPVADAGGNQTILDRDGNGSEEFILYGIDSYDSDGTIASYLWQEDATTLSTDPAFRQTMSVGSHTITLTVTDDQSDTDTDTVTVTINALVGPKQLLNLKDTPTSDRFPKLFDLVWPVNSGEVDICLWADDKFAALSITVDDGDPDHDWWLAICQQYGWKMTWFKSGLTNDDWTEFTRLYTAGHEVQNHTFSHTATDDIRPESDVIWEYLGGARYIEQQIPGNVVDTLAYPNGSGNRDIAALMNLAVRGVIGGGNWPHRTDYMNTRCIGTIDAYSDIDAIIYGTSTTEWMGNNQYIRGWANALYHWVNDKPAHEPHLAYVNDHADLIWVGSFGDVARYGQERDTAVLTVTTNTSSQVAFTLTDDMDDTKYDHPLDIKIRMYPAWTGVTATQGGSSIPASVVNHLGDNYALVKAVPDQGAVVVLPSGTGNIPPAADAGPDQTVTDTDDNGSENITLDGTDSTDSDGVITSYVWRRNAQQIATGTGQTVSFDVGAHTVELTVTDDDAATGTDTVLITVNAPSGGGGAGTLTVTEITGDYYTVTAHELGAAANAYWEIKVDVQSGCIFSFKDLTDAGIGGGQHTSYLGTDAYSRQCGLVWFGGRGGHVLTRQGSVAGLVDRLTFTTAGDNSSFTISYTEDASSADYFHDVYSAGATSLAPGDLETTIELVITPPDETGTAWDWTITSQNVSTHGLAANVWAQESVRSYINGALSVTSDSETSMIDGAWNDADPKSYFRWTVGANPTEGLTTGREIIIDREDQLAGYTFGGNVTTNSWAGFNFGQYYTGYVQGGPVLAAGATRVTTGTVMIDILGAAGSANVAPTAHAGADQTVTDSDDNGAEDVTLNGVLSTDSDGSIVSYAWEENSVPLDTGVSPTVSFAVGGHTVELTVTDDDSATDTDTVSITVNAYANAAPAAHAGSDQTVTDSDDNGSEDVTLDGASSTDSDGSIVSYVWEENSSPLDTGVSPTVSLDVNVHTIDLTVTDDDAATDSDSVVITVNAAPTGGSTTVTYQIAASADDGMATSTNNVPSAATLYLPDFAGNYRGYMRWAVSIPAGATVTDAYISARSNGGYPVTPTVRLQLLDYDNSPDFTATPYGLPVTATYVDWVTTAWASLQWYDSSDISALVQEFIDRTGYQSGNYLGLRGINPSGSDYKRVYSYDYSDNLSAPKLVVTYTSGAGNQPPTANAGPDQTVTDSDDNGSESVTLNGSNSTDSDGSIVSYVWEENSSPLDTGVSPTVSLDVNVHTIDLTVTDDDAATDTDSVVITVSAYTNAAPTANAGPDQTVTDTDDNGTESVTLDGSNSTDSDGSIVSYVWEENSSPLDTGVSPTVSLDVNVHTIDLTVTDDDAATDTDSVVITVNAAPAQGAATLTVVETVGDYYTITAHDSVDSQIEYWELKVDVQSGCIFSFKDLTDAGDGQGGHSSYLDSNAYTRQCGLVWFDGRGGNVLTRLMALDELASHLTFDTAGDGSSFTITYAEDATTTDYFHNSYNDGAYTLSPGDMVTTITLVITPPDATGTVWDWSISSENVSGHTLSAKIWAAEFVATYLYGGVTATSDYDTTLADGAWDDQSPESYLRWTIGSNPSLGLTQGREIVVDFQTGVDSLTNGMTVTASSWAGFNYLRMTSPFDYSTHLPDGGFRDKSGQVLIDIPAQ